MLQSFFALRLVTEPYLRLITNHLFIDFGSGELPVTQRIGVTAATIRSRSSAREVDSFSGCFVKGAVAHAAAPFFFEL